MSSFKSSVRNKDSGEVKGCFFYDDYFGRHRYGMVIDGEDTVLTQDQFLEKWERVDER